MSDDNTMKKAAAKLMRRGTGAAANRRSATAEAAPVADTPVGVAAEVAPPMTFAEWLATPDGMGATDPRIPDTTSIRVTVLTDRLRSAWLAAGGLP